MLRTQKKRTAGALTNAYIEYEFEMASQSTSPLPVGQVLEISFASFTPRITIHSERELTVEIIAGDNVGFSDTVEYRGSRWPGNSFMAGTHRKHDRTRA